MSASNALSDLDAYWGAGIEDTAEAEPLPPPPDVRPAAILRGTARGLDIVVHGRASAAAVADAVTERLAEAPSFFRGNDVRIKIEDGPLAAGVLARLDDIAGRFDMRIVEVGAAAKPVLAGEAVPTTSLAAGSAPSPASPGLDESPTVVSTPVVLRGNAPELMLDDVLSPSFANVIAALSQASPPRPGRGSPIPQEQPVIAAVAAVAPEPVEPTVERTRVVLGPVRSGVILDHGGNLIVFGDVNPGAEVRAEGNIVVLGRLRGTAHAGIGRDNAFIIALRLEPQQLRIARQVARAGENDAPGSEPEIAHIAGGGIIVERYQGRLPKSLADSIVSS